jgi:NTP pyrophosphatase (non-canonical NTP hydrolase)
MTLNEYQHAAVGTAIYPGRHSALGLSYTALKLNGEAGEVAENVGKAIRDDAFGQQIEVGGGGTVQTPLTAERREKLLKELGDTLWYIAACADEIGYTLESVAQENIEKLADRARRGVLGGSGDDR